MNQNRSTTAKEDKKIVKLAVEEETTKAVKGIYNQGLVLQFVHKNFIQGPFLLLVTPSRLPRTVLYLVMAYLCRKRKIDYS